MHKSITIRVPDQIFSQLIARADRANDTVTGLSRSMVLDALADQDRADALQALETRLMAGLSDGFAAVLQSLQSFEIVELGHDGSRDPK